MPKAKSAAVGSWLVKQEPGAYPFSQLVKDQRTAWEGVRNFQARNNLRDMRRGDVVLYYHSGDDKAVVGVARVAREAYPDPSSDDSRWLAVDLEPVKALTRPVPLDEIRRDPALAETALVKHTRLSVLPLSGAELARFLRLGRTSL